MRRQDESGILTRDEMECVDDNLLPRRLLDSACVGSMLDFFDFLDVEEKGEMLGCSCTALEWLRHEFQYHYRGNR